MTTLHCPDCDCDITGVTVDEITDCASHLSHEQLIEHYRWLRGEHQRLQMKVLDFFRGTALEKIEADLKEANQSRAKLGAERYLLERKVEELESKARYWKATAEEYEEALRQSLLRKLTEASEKTAEARGRGEWKMRQGNPLTGRQDRFGSAY